VSGHKRTTPKSTVRSFRDYDKNMGIVWFKGEREHSVKLCDECALHSAAI